MGSMKNILVFVIVGLSSFVGLAQKVPPKASLDTLPSIALPGVKHDAFHKGEYLRFRLHYGLIDAGEAELQIYESSRLYHGREAYHIVGKGRTLGAFDWFFKVRDRYETYVDKDGVFPWEFIRNIREGSYIKEHSYRFYQNKSAVRTDKGDIYKIPPFSQDMLSAFYYARTIDFSRAYDGQVFTIPTFVDGEEYPLKIRFIGRETLKSRTGTYRCLKFVPVVQEGRIFEKEEDMTVWITDDENKIPILAKAKVLVGSIKMELVEYKNISNPLAKVN